MTSRTASAGRLRKMLSLSGHPLSLYQTEAMYHVQVDYTCQLLDVVDEVCDEVTAGLITDAIYGRLTGTGASAADQRVREAREALASLTRNPPPIWQGGFRGGAEP